MNEVSVRARATTISINDYTTKTFEKYTRTLVHFHRWNSSPPQYIYLNLHGKVRDSKSVNGSLIVYGVKEYVSNVDPSVYDAAFTIENGQMEMQADLSLNGHHLRGSIHHIHGFLNTKNGNTFLLNGFVNTLIPRLSRILTIKLCNCKPIMRLPPVSLKIKHGSLLSLSKIYTSTQDGSFQTVSMPLGFMAVELGSVVKDEELLLLIEYRTS